MAPESAGGMTAPESAASAFLPGLRAMLAEMRVDPEIVRPSEYWKFLNNLNLEQLDDRGFREFKRTVNQNYFNWPARHVRDSQFRVLLRHWLARPTPRVFSARVEGSGHVEVGPEREDLFDSARNRKRYALFVALLWEYARRVDHRGLLARLEEPELGRPITVSYRDRSISQDLCNSVLEFYSITDALPGDAPGGNGVLELGSGYGRLAWVFLREFPGCRYILCDIPPALAVAQSYLSALFPGLPIFEFRHFEHFEQVRAEMEAASILFLTPNQLDLVPPLDVGLFVTVSSLHEMRSEQIEHYVECVDVHCKGGYFYSKQWERSVNNHDGLVIRREDYPIPSDWEIVFERRHPVQTRFFEGLYSLPRRWDAFPPL